MKFLHISDIHLGKKLYKSQERSDDFFLTLQDVLNRYAIQEKVNFVLIGGDFFDVRNISPATMNQAIVCLKSLKENNIEVIAIEGNHDSHEHSSEFSWMRSLSKWGYFKLLEPEFTESGIVLSSWNDDTRKGSYIDIGNVRIYGTVWFGSSVEKYLSEMLEIIKLNHDAKKFNILMLHTDVEGQLNRPIPGLPVKKLQELKSYIDYIALGHIHKNFEIDNCIYNPGSLEACTVDEYENIRGAYLVELKRKKHTVKLVRDYRQREIIRYGYDITKYTLDNIKDFHIDLLESMKKESFFNKDYKIAPIFELTLFGTSSLKNSDFKIEQCKDKIKNCKLNPMLVLLRNHISVVGVEFSQAESSDRHSLEKKIINKLLEKTQYKAQQEKTSEFILEVKNKALRGENPLDIATFIQKNLL